MDQGFEGCNWEICQKRCRFSAQLSPSLINRKNTLMIFADRKQMIIIKSRIRWIPPALENPGGFLQALESTCWGGCFCEVSSCPGYYFISFIVLIWFWNKLFTESVFCLFGLNVNIFAKPGFCDCSEGTQTPNPATKLETGQKECHDFCFLKFTFLVE